MLGRSYCAVWPPSTGRHVSAMSEVSPGAATPCPSGGSVSKCRPALEDAVRVEVRPVGPGRASAMHDRGMVRDYH